MLKRAGSRPVAEEGVGGGNERIFYEIRRTLRTTGVGLNFRIWASHRRFFPSLWEALRPNLETRAFEHEADRLRAEAVETAALLGRVKPFAEVALGPSQAYQLGKALDAHHYAVPKLLLLTSALTLSLRGEGIGGLEIPCEDRERIERGAPSGMAPWELEPDPPREPDVRLIFRDLRRSLSLPWVDDFYRALALWPEYLAVAWQDLRPFVGSDRFRSAGKELRFRARELARALPFPMPVPSSPGMEVVIEECTLLERAFSWSILVVALLKLENATVEEASLSPFPVTPRMAPREESFR